MGMFRKSSPKSFSEFYRNRGGNFAIVLALLAPVLLAAASLSIDISKMMGTKTHLAGVADSAALAASSAMADQGLSAADAKALAIRYIDGQLGTEIWKNGNTTAQSASVVITDTSNGGSAHTYNVAVDIGYQVQLSGLSQLIGMGNKVVHVSSTAQSATQSLGAASLYLVLDRSGSMNEYTNTKSGRGYVRKIDALKTSVQNLAKQLHDADPTAMYVRTGAISYNTSPQTPTNLAWGETGIVSYVNSLYASGGTDSSNAVKAAYLSLKRATEDNAHKAKNGQVPTKYIVFMTDGDNNYSSADRSTEKWCDKAKKKKIEIYTIGFMAPSNGKALLNYCATDTSHYFDAQNADDLYKAFETIGSAAAAKVSRLTS